MESGCSLPHSKNPTTSPYPSQINPFLAPSLFLKIHFNIIPPAMPRSSNLSCSLKFLHQNHISTSTLTHTCHISTSTVTHTCHMPHPPNPYWFITQIIVGEECRSQSSKSCSFLQSPITCSLLVLNIFLSTLFPLSPCSSLRVTNQVSHPYQTTGKFIVLNILIFIFSNSKMEGKIFCTKQ